MYIIYTIIPAEQFSTGLDSLISKEWIALGHPFAQRLLGVRCTMEDKSTTPTFLLFLDCLAQLIRLYPMQFNYSHHLLIALWDVSLTGVVPAFSANSVADQLSVARSGGPFPLSRFFHAEYTALFSNIVNDAAQAVQQFSIFNSRSLTPLIYDILRPPTLPIDVVFWNECYLRWIPPANIRQFQQLKSNSNMISSAYPYSNAETIHCNGLSQLDSSDDTVSVSSISISSIRVKDKKLKYRGSVTMDSLSVISGIYPSDECEGVQSIMAAYNSQNTSRTPTQCEITYPQNPKEQLRPLPLTSSLSNKRAHHNPSVRCSTSKHIPPF
uniref:Myotubularin phosphatase domain-containing protein n=1 Tax=Heterorhabditis bacteriophora TaxID=37862 RepID=A0A1I7XQJ7_HETBA